MLLRRVGPLDQPISVARRLQAAGLSLRGAHDAITRLAASDWAMCDVTEAGDLRQLATDLAAMNVCLLRRRHVDEPSAMILDIRTRHRLSQREFADRLGLDVRTLQNWEQGRNRPDTAVLSLVMLFDRHPDLVEQVAFERIGAAAP